MIRRFFSFLYSPAFWTFIGLLVLCCVILFFGQGLALGSWRPLSPRWARVVTVGLILALASAKWLRRQWVSYQRGRKIELDATHRASDGPPSDPYKQELEAGFQKALRQLKEARRQSPQSGWWTRLHAGLNPSAYLYERPWYMVVGNPQVGKTAMLLNSGLHFPLLEQFGIKRVSGHGNTRNCDWFFAEQAVLLDTAGRYTSQSATPEQDRKEWRGFLHLLRQNRPQQPINGVLLTVSLEELVGKTASSVEQLAASLRQRLQELRRETATDFPVYLLLTQFDKLGGFLEFFSHLDEKECKQPWGATFPFEKDKRRQNYALLFEQKFHALLQRLEAQLPDRLSGESEARRRAWMYLFPQHFSSLREPLQHLIGNVFAPALDEQPICLRGFFFVSSLQEGLPVVPSAQAAIDAGLMPPPLAPLPRLGKRYFLNEVFEQIVFAEAGLAGNNLTWRRRRLILLTFAHLACWAAALGTLLIGAGAYRESQASLGKRGEDAQGVEDQVRTMNAPSRSELTQQLLVWDAMWQLAKAEDNDAQGNSSMLKGLYSGKQVPAAAKATYRQLLEDTLLPQLIAQLQSVLKNPQTPLPTLYATLRTYLSLQNPRHFDAARTSAWATTPWSQDPTHPLSQEQIEALHGHLDRLFTAVAQNENRKVRLDSTLVQETRAKLRQVSLSELIYQGIQQKGAPNDIQPFRLVDVAGPVAITVFDRAAINASVPALYTKEGYRRVLNEQLPAATQEILGEHDWVMGDSASPPSDTRNPSDKQAQAYQNEVRRLYLQQYATQWENFIASIKLVPVDKREVAFATVDRLLGAEAPLERVLRSLARETSLRQVDSGEKKADGEAATPPADGRIIAAAKRLLPSSVNTASSAASAVMSWPGNPAAALDTDAGAAELEAVLVDHRFEGLQRLVQGNAAPDPSQVAQLMALLKGYRIHLLASNEAINRSMPPPPATDLLLQFKAAINTAPPPVAAILSQLTERLDSIKDWQGVAEQKLKSEVTPFCISALSGRYPFIRTSQEDVRLDDFIQIFAPGGTLDRFFQANLADKVDTGRRPWVFRDGQRSSAGLTALYQGSIIRDVFFGGGNQPRLSVEVTPLHAEKTDEVLFDIGGTKIHYYNDMVNPVSINFWPITRPEGRSVNLRFTLHSKQQAGSGYSGDWALFHALDAATVTSTQQPERFRAVFKLKGAAAEFSDKSVEFEFKTSSVRNPFTLPELRNFRCPASL